MTAYDVTPYPDLAYAQTHPDRLAVMARLFGLNPASVATCRVLEIGCAAGGNCLPMAAALPQAEFVGIDASARQIALGQERLARLGLENVRLLQRDLRAPVDDLGRFDFILAHGVYSWVAADVRHALLTLCRDRLHPHGIAYVSYNTFPGWHGASIVRELMQFHTRGIADPSARAQAARAVVRQVAAMIPPEVGDYGAIFRHYGEALSSGLKGGEDAFLLHDELEEINQPVYFHEFVAHADRCGLRFVCEAALRDAMMAGLPAQTLDQIRTLAQDEVDVEQYSDFVRGRMFRQSLLCHAIHTPARRVDAGQVMQMWVRSRAERVPEAHLPPGWVQVRSEDGMTLTTGHAVTAAAMDLLIAARPNALYFTDLLARAQKTAGASAVDDAPTLAQNLLRGCGYSHRLIDLHTHPARCADRPGERPVAWAVARLEAETRNVVTNGWHERVWLTTAQCRLLVLLDGTRTLDELCGCLRSETAQGESPWTAADVAREAAWLARAGLLAA